MGVPSTVQCKDSLDTVEGLIVGIVLVGRRRQFLPDGDENLEH